MQLKLRDNFRIYYSGYWLVRTNFLDFKHLFKKLFSGIVFVLHFHHFRGILGFGWIPSSVQIITVQVLYTVTVLGGTNAHDSHYKANAKLSHDNWVVANILFLRCLIMIYHLCSACCL